MKIATIGPTYPFRGGIAHYTTLLVRHLRRGHEVRFYSYRRQYPRLLFPGNTSADPSVATLLEPCERTIDTLNPLTWWLTARRIVAVRPDILLLQWWTPFWIPLLLIVSWAARRAGIPILFISHQFIEPDSSLVEWFLARMTLRLADGLIVMTEEEFGMARRVLPVKPIRAGHLTLFEGFPRQHLSRAEARGHLGIDPDVPLLLFFGFVRRYKGLRYLLDALAKLPDRVYLVVAGEFWEDEHVYREQIRRLGLEDRVVVHNRYIPNEAIEPYFAAADALVLPYITGSQSAVGMTGLHYGVPVIATNVGGLAETIGHSETGLIVPPADSAALAGAIDHFFRDRLGERFRATIAQERERLSWEALIRIIEELSNAISGLRAPAGASGHDAASDDRALSHRPGIQ
jgi:glycosyltransferase involved in cell wall biosynthesis